MGIIVFAIIAVGVVAGINAVMDGSLSINFGTLFFALFVVCLAFLFGGIFSRDHNRDRDINGEIEGQLQQFTDQHSRLLYQLRGGMPVEDKLKAIEQADEAFRKSIEYGRVTDGAENYYSYRKGVK